MSAEQDQRAPPPLPPDSIYTPCYCEENVYLLAQAFASNAEADADWPWQAFVVFVSNHGKTVRTHLAAHAIFPLCPQHQSSSRTRLLRPRSLSGARKLGKASWYGTTTLSSFSAAACSAQSKIRHIAKMASNARRWQKMAGCTIMTPDSQSLASGQVRPRSARLSPTVPSAADCPAMSALARRLPGRPAEYVANTFPYVFDATFVVPPEYQR